MGKHSRSSRRGYGFFIPGGEIYKTSSGEEVFCYFEPGDMKPPLNVYFAGYKKREGFEGYNIEVKYLLEDVWKGLDDYAQHTYGIVVDVSAKDGYELPWADEERKGFSHFGEVWIDNGHSYNMGYFDTINPNAVESYGYKTQNEEGEDVLRFLLLAEVDEGYKPDKDTKVSFNVNVVFWGVGDPFKTEGRFTASVTFDEARALDLALTIPCQDVSAE